MENDKRPAAAPFPEPIDWATLDGLRQYQSEGEPDLVQELIGIYRSDSPPLLDAMRKAIAAGDADALRKAAHALKGSSANLGAQQVSAVSAELEKLGRSGTVQGAEALFARLESEFARALAALASRGPA